MTRFNATIRTFETAAEYLGKKDSRPIGHNTRVVKENDISITTISIKYHDTRVVVFDEFGRTVLNSGGWKTPTTKDRINAFCPAGYSVSQSNNIWTLNDRIRARDYLFKDGLVINGGIVMGAGSESDIKEILRLKKRIRKYAAGIAAAWAGGKIKGPDAGDCFYCYMREVNSGIPLGEHNHDISHLESHMEESYYVPSLLLRAVEKYDSPFVTGMIYSHMVNGDIGNYKDSAVMWIKRAVRRYFYHEFGIGG